MKTAGTIILAALLLLCLPPVSQAGWRFVSPMPHGRYGHDAAVGPGGRIHVMGGMVFKIQEGDKVGRKYNDGRYSNLAYDRSRDSWTYLEPVPGAVTAYNRKDKHGKPYGPNTFYYGNPGDGWMIVNEVYGEKNLFEIYGPKSRRGERITIDREILRNTDFHRQGDGTRIVVGGDGLIYWLGGREIWLDHADNIVLPFNPETNKWPRAWTEKFHPPREIPDSYPEELKKELSRRPSNIVEHRTFFDTDVPPMHEKRLDHEAVLTPDNRICVLGGANRDEQKQYHVLDSMECYDPGKNAWEYRSPMPTRKMLFGAVAVPDGRIFVFGGREKVSAEKGTPFYDTVEVYDPGTDTWSKRDPMPEPRATHAAVMAPDGRIFIIGGAKSYRGEPLKTVLIYDPATDTWARGPDMNVPRSTLSAVATPDGKIYAIGGTDVGAYPGRERFNFFLPRNKEFYTGRVQETVEVFDITTLD